MGIDDVQRYKYAEVSKKPISPVEGLSNESYLSLSQMIRK